MRTHVAAAFFLAAVPAALIAASHSMSSAQTPPRTMRVDYFHTGNAESELFSFDRVVLEPLPWPGNPRKAIDESNLGRYFFEVIDRPTNKVVYSRGFDSVYGEWQTTGEAKEIRRTFSESLRFPAPSGPVQISLKKRDPQGAFREVWTVLVDPKDVYIDSAPPLPAGPLLTIQKSGEPSDKVDFLILGDGYTAAERGKFEKDARRLADLLFAVEPFKSRRSDFNVWALCPATEVSGISRPSVGIHRRSRIGSSYDAFGSERYILTYDNRSFRDVASLAPYDFVEILTNTRTYGGGGIFGQYSTVAADSLWAPYVFVHEFGHHFAALADEYFTSPVSYEPSPGPKTEPWEENITALLDPNNLKWKDLVTPGTPLPTPWKKEEFEKASREFQAKRREIRKVDGPEDDMDKLFQEELVFETKLLGTDQHSGKVGAFEGALYESKGYYRPQEDCIMFTRDEVPFCAVCRRALSHQIDRYSR